MVMKVPEFKEKGLSDFLTNMINERERGDKANLSKLTANESVLLQSTGGKVYKVIVDDDGVISTVLMAG